MLQETPRAFTFPAGDQLWRQEAKASIECTASILNAQSHHKVKQFAQPLLLVQPHCFHKLPTEVVALFPLVVYYGSKSINISEILNLFHDLEFHIH